MFVRRSLRVPRAFAAAFFLECAAFAVPALAVTDPPADATITGESGGIEDTFGWSVSSRGDVNGDGVTDVFVGAPTHDGVAGYAGKAYLFYGPIDHNLAAASANARIAATTFGDNLGVSVAITGDVNDDGKDDLLVGARGHDVPDIQAGRAYLFHGPRSGNVAPTSATATFTGTAFEELGWSVDGGGDVNGDGFADIVMGAPNFGDTQNFSVGRAYLFNGPVAGTHAAATADAIVTGEFVNDQLGTSVAIVGDLNDDGFDDLALGAPHGPIVFLDPGRAYVFFGPVAGSLSAAAADVVLFGEEINDLFGTTVASAGDVNGDGLGDLLVGAEQTFNDGPGKAYLYLGPLLATARTATPTATFIGEVSKDAFGHSVASAGDVNGDGFGDIVIGAWDNAGGGARAGRAYLFLGPLAGRFDAEDADLILTGGAEGDRFGFALACAGDQDDDGLDDLLVGAAQFPEGSPGLAHLYLGASFATGVPTLPELAGAGIGPAFPNPTRGAATFATRLDRETTIGLVVLDAAGRRVRVEAPRLLAPGVHQVTWDGRDDRGRAVASGVYFVRLEGSGVTSTKSVTLVR